MNRCPRCTSRESWVFHRLHCYTCGYNDLRDYPPVPYYPMPTPHVEWIDLEDERWKPTPNWHDRLLGMRGPFATKPTPTQIAHTCGPEYWMAFNGRPVS